MFFFFDRQINKLSLKSETAKIYTSQKGEVWNLRKSGALQKKWRNYFQRILHLIPALIEILFRMFYIHIYHLKILYFKASHTGLTKEFTSLQFLQPKLSPPNNKNSGCLMPIPLHGLWWYPEWQNQKTIWWEKISVYFLEKPHRMQLTRLVLEDRVASVL